jgi:hypothetical protein
MQNLRLLEEALEGLGKAETTEFLLQLIKEMIRLSTKNNSDGTLYDVTRERIRKRGGVWCAKR